MILVCFLKTLHHITKESLIEVVLKVDNGEGDISKGSISDKVVLDFRLIVLCK